MRRFYKSATAAAVEGGWTVLLDGRPIRTPGRAPLTVPTEALARAMAAEWEAQGETVTPASMPLTGFANAAIDRVPQNRDAFIDELAAYGDTDLVYYRADHPSDLVARQADAWDPIIAWAGRRFGASFELVTGITHRPQPAETLARLRSALEKRDDFHLTPMQPLVTISGSLLIALALAEGVIDADAAWAAGQLDELYQAEQWGEDALAAKSRAARRDTLDNAVRFLRLLDQPV